MSDVRQAARVRYLKEKHARIQAREPQAEAARDREIAQAFHSDNRIRAAQAEAARPETWDEYARRMAKDPSMHDSFWDDHFSSTFAGVDWSAPWSENEARLEGWF